MMGWIIRSSLQLRVVVVALAALLVIFGFTELEETPVDVLPEFTRPYVEIQTEALGLSAPGVEALITTPLEADLLNGVSWVEEIRSESIPGLSSIVLIFEKGIDIIRARQMVQERLIAVHALPNVSKPPVMLNPLSSANRSMVIGLTSDSLSLIDMSVLARWTIKPRLMGIPGVANVSIWGQRKRQLQVQVDPERLRDAGVTMGQVIKTTGNALWASPLSFLEASTPGTGGWIDTPNQRLGIRHLLPITTAADLSKVPIDGDAEKSLGDVAMVVEDHQLLIGDAIVKDAPALMLVVEKFPWANTAEVTEEVEEALAALRPGLSGLEMDSSLFRPATFLELALDNLSRALTIGAVLGVLALLACLFNWRSALISIVAGLVSALVAALVLHTFDVIFNMMIIAGLMIALSALIDDAIVDIEHIMRRLRAHRQAGEERSTARILLEAALEMRSVLVYATLIMVLAVLPLLFLEGVVGAFYQPLLTSYLLALLASFVVALTVTPALSMLLLRSDALPSGDSLGASMLSGLYQTLFSWAVRTPRAVFVVVLVIGVAGLLSMLGLRQESLLPNFKETNLVVRWDGSSSASHPAMSRIATLASSELRTIAGVETVSALIGRAVLSDKRTGINAGELWISIDPNADYDATVAEVKEVVNGYPGLSREVLTYLEAKVREELSGTDDSLVVRVYGEDMDILRNKADEVRKIMARIDGIVDATVQYPPEVPTVEIEVDLDRAKRYGLKPGDIRRATTTLVSGIEVGNLFENQKVFDVVVWGTPKLRRSLTDIQELVIDAPGGKHALLKDVADVRIVPVVHVINRDAVARRIDVTATVRERDFAAIATAVERGIRKVNFPLEYRAELLGEYVLRLDAQERMVAFAIAAALGIFLLLQVFFRSWRLALVVFVTLPMALVGGVLAVFITSGGLLSLGSIVGFIAVLGIAVRHGLALVSHYRQLEQQDGETFGAELIQRATKERSAPILTAAVTTALVFLPLAFFGNIAGLEIGHAIAIVVLGGLVTATLFNLVGVPAMYVLFGAARESDLGELAAIGTTDLTSSPPRRTGIPAS